MSARVSFATARLRSRSTRNGSRARSTTPVFIKRWSTTVSRRKASAPYGRPDAIKPLLKTKSDEVDVPEWGVEFDKPFWPEHERDWEASPSMQHWKDVAWRVQDDAESLLRKRATWLREATGAKNLSMAGGVALNCVANGRIVREAGFDNVWIQPAAGDDGIAIGCAYYGYLAILKKQRS